MEWTSMQAQNNMIPSAGKGCMNAARQHDTSWEMCTSLHVRRSLHLRLCCQAQWGSGLQSLLHTQEVGCVACFWWCFGPGRTEGQAGLRLQDASGWFFWHACEAAHAGRSPCCCRSTPRTHADGSSGLRGESLKRSNLQGQAEAHTAVPIWWTSQWQADRDWGQHEDVLNVCCISQSGRLWCEWRSAQVRSGRSDMAPALTCTARSDALLLHNRQLARRYKLSLGVVSSF